MHDPDLEEHKLFSTNEPTYTTVNAGQILYIPDGWYHTVGSLVHDIGLTLTLFIPMGYFDHAAGPRCLDLERFADATASA
jgi:hypothetical protein